MSEETDPDSEQLPEHQRPEEADDATVEAVGKVSEALECVEEARGLLYTFHRRMGTADLTLGEGVKLLREAGHDRIADRVERDVVGRNVLHGRWTFQVVEEYDETYYQPFKDAEAWVRDELMAGRRHVYEAEMKERERTEGRRHMEPLPDDSGPQAG